MSFYEDDYPQQEDTVYVWNMVTKQRLCVDESKAQAIIAKQKYPQNWTVVDVCSCGNCGGSWDGNQDCRNYCFGIIRHREDPNLEPTDLGEVNSWNEVFEKVWGLFGDEQVDMLATISASELANGQWFAPMLSNWQVGDKTIPADEVLRQMATTCPQVYADNDRFHLFAKDMMVEGLGRLHRAYTQFVVVYLKPGEQFAMPAPQSEAIAS